MLSSRLIVAICDTEDSGFEVLKLVHVNRHGSLVPYMKDYCLGYDHICGTPEEGGKYLLTDVSLNGITPDILFERTIKVHGRNKTDRMYAYLFDDLTPKGYHAKE